MFDSLFQVAHLKASSVFMGWVWILLLFKTPFIHHDPKPTEVQLDINSSYIPFTQSMCVASTKTPIRPISASQIFALDIRFLCGCMFFWVSFWASRNQFRKLAPNIEEKSVKPVTIASIYKGCAFWCRVIQRPMALGFLSKALWYDYDTITADKL